MCEDCDYGPPDLPAIPPGAFSDLVKIADAWVKSIHDSIDHLKNEHDELRKEMSNAAILKEIRVKMGELQHAHLSFEAALDTFRAEYMGRQWGIMPFFLPEFPASYARQVEPTRGLESVRTNRPHPLSGSETQLLRASATASPGRRTP